MGFKKALLITLVILLLLGGLALIFYDRTWIGVSLLVLATTISFFKMGFYSLISKLGL